MSIETTTSIEVTPSSVATSVENSGDLVSTTQHDVCVQPAEELINVVKKEYAIVGDGLFASVTTEEAPDWLTGLIDNLIDSALLSGFSDYDQLRQDVLSAIDSIDLANNNYVSTVIMNQTIDSSLVAKVDQLNANLDNKFATITNVDAAFVTSDLALATSINDVKAEFTDEIDARVTSMTSALANADSAIASDLTALSSVFTNQESGLSGVADAVSGLQTYVGVDAANVPNSSGIDATLAAHAESFTNLKASLTGAPTTANALTSLRTQSLAYTDGVATGVENKFAYDSELILGGSYYKSGFGLDSSGITQVTDGTTPETAFDSNFWINAERLVLKSPSFPGVSASFAVTASGIQLSVDHTEATKNTPKGTYSAGTEYEPGDIVSYSGSSYLSLLSQTGVTPIDNDIDWQLLSAVGTNGSDGATGAQGVQGVQGAPGTAGANGATGERGTAVLAYAVDLGGIVPGGVTSISLAAYWDEAASAALDVEKAGDTLLVTNINASSGWTHIYEFNGSSWVSATAFTVNGNQVVTGTLAATALIGGALTSSSADANGPLFELDLDGIARFRGIEIRDSSNNVIMASGAAMDYTALGGTKPPADADSTAAVTAGNGANIANARYSAFESAAPVSGTTNGSVLFDTAQKYFGTQSLKLSATTSDCYTYLSSSTSDFNIPLLPNTSYILSAFTRGSTDNRVGSLYLYQNNGVHIEIPFNSGVAAGEWRRVSGVVTTGTAVTMGMVRVDNDGGSGGDMWFDGIMLEPQVGNLTTPSIYVPPSSLDNTASSFTDQGAFSTLNTITPANASTYIADLAVDSLQIANQAVTIPNSSGLEADQTVTRASGWISIRDVEHVASGAPIEIMVAAHLRGSTSSTLGYLLQVTRGATVIFDSNMLYCPGSNGVLTSFALKDEPAAGTYTYHFKVQVGFGTGNIIASDRYIRTLETKK